MYFPYIYSLKFFCLSPYVYICVLKNWLNRMFMYVCMYVCMYVSVYLSINSKKLTHTIMKAKQSHIKEGNFL